MNIVTLIARIKNTVQDASFSNQDILDHINEGVRTVAGIVALPSLETIATVTASTSSDNISLPTGFHNHLRSVYASGRRKNIPIYSNIVHMNRDRLPAGSLISKVCVSGGKLYYAPTPGSDEALEIVYHAFPVTYASATATDATDILPTYLGPKILHAYVCMSMFEVIEDGLDGQKINTMRWEQVYEKALGELILFVGPLYTRPVGIFDEMGF